MRARLAAFALAAALPACREPPKISCQCGYDCNDAGVRDGNANISQTGVDAYFAGVVGYTRAAAQLDAEVDAELQAIARSLGLAPSATAAEIRAAAVDKLASATESLHVQVEASRCVVSTDAATMATSRCESASATMCDGACSPNANACGAGEAAMCTGTQLACAGECAGDCVLAVAAACEGTCRGECDGACSVRDAVGACAGQCDGNCLGTCAQAGGACDGTCEGVCESAAPPGGCAAGSQATCTADGAVACAGQCDGTVTLAATSACTVAAQAMVNLGARCDPPRPVTAWQWRAALLDDAAGQAAFKAWLAEFEVRSAKLTAASRRAQLVLRVGADLRAAIDLVRGDIEARFAEDAPIRQLVGLSCAQSELDSVEAVLDGGAATLQAALSDATKVSSVLGAE
jgi:hypothetical protein